MTDLDQVLCDCVALLEENYMRHWARELGVLDELESVLAAA